MKNRSLWLIVCLALLLIVPGSISQAARGDREALEFGYVNVVSGTLDEAIIARPAYIYAVTVYAGASNAHVDFYDSASLQTNGTAGAAYWWKTQALAEVGEATQYQTKRVQFDPPIFAQNGVYADTSNTANYVIEYR